MGIEWHDLAAAFALYLVLEGVMPFLSPPALKRAFATMLGLPDGVLRLAGLGSMLAGCALLYLIRG
jgi:uncharacterized protein YjeT (DUF2065 family)